jgi:hypothetical protein
MTEEEDRFEDELARDDLLIWLALALLAAAVTALIYWAEQTP